MNRFLKEAWDIIKDREGLRLKSYLDTGGVWTIGWGHTGPEVVEGLIIDEVTAGALAVSDLNKFCIGIEKLVTVPLNDYQFSALVSFCYNIGLERFKTSTLLRKLNNGDYIGASNEFSKWKYDNGVELPGLIIRRQKEKDLFEHEMVY